MKKMKFLPVLAFAFLIPLLMVGGAHAANANTKVGYVDLNRALNEVAEGKKAKEKLESEGKAKQRKLEIMQTELQKLKDELDKDKLILSQEALNQKGVAFQQKVAEFQQMQMSFQQEFAEMEANLTRPIGEKLKAIIEELGKTGEYTIVLPKEMVLYAPPGTDLTDEVIARYNKKK